MQAFLAITKALSDENRVRILLTLREGELCLCQIVEVLNLAPSTVSKHVDILRQAGLIHMRKQGRWHYYRLVSRQAPPMVRQAIRWALQNLEDQAVVLNDLDKLCCIRQTDPKELTGCYDRS